jgi:hypothetical protein
MGDGEKLNRIGKGYLVTENEKNGIASHDEPGIKHKKIP